MLAQAGELVLAVERDQVPEEDLSRQVDFCEEAQFSTRNGRSNQGSDDRPSDLLLGRSGFPLRRHRSLTSAPSAWDSATPESRLPGPEPGYGMYRISLGPTGSGHLRLATHQPVDLAGKNGLAQSYLPPEQ